MVILAMTAVAGAAEATTAAAFRWGASVGWVVASAVADDAGGAIARTVRCAATGWAGRTGPAAGMLASRTRTPAASRTMGPRLIALCSQPLAESQLVACGSHTLWLERRRALSNGSHDRCAIVSTPRLASPAST